MAPSPEELMLARLGSKPRNPAAKWRTIAPLSRYWDDGLLPYVPLELSDGVVLDRIPEVCKRDDVLEALAWTQRYDIQRTHYALEASGAGPDPHDGERSRAIPGTTRLTTATQAMWIAKPTNLSYEALLRFEGNDDRVADAATFNRQTALHPYFTARFAADDVATARELHRSILSLPRDGVVWLTLALLNAAREDHYAEIAYLMTWVAIEALFGSEAERRGIKARLVRRIGRFLGPASPVAGDRVGELYVLRCDVSHGSRAVQHHTLPAALFESQELLRGALRRILLDADVQRLVDSIDREKLLDGP